MTNAHSHDPSCVARRAIGDPRVQLDHAVVVENRPPPGVQLGIVLEAAHCFLDRIKCGGVAKDSVCWSAFSGQSSKEGCRVASYNVRKGLIVANAQKADAAGKLKMVLRIGGKVVDQTSTTAEYCLVNVSE
jgi:hypothetical protein